MGMPPLGQPLLCFRDRKPGGTLPSTDRRAIACGTTSGSVRRPRIR